MLEIKNLVKTYKSKKSTAIKALRGVSANFGDKGLVFLLGKSGSGKSTLLNIIGGIDKATDGEVVVQGKSSKGFTQTDYDSYRNTYIGFVFQEYNLLDSYTVGENVALALELQGKAAEQTQVETVLRQLDLVDDRGKTLGSRKTNELSGGQKQRVAIARALVKNPKIILADEPTGALDSSTGEQLYEVFKSLSKNKLIIVVTHDRENAEKYGDRIIELKDGEIIGDNTKAVGGSFKAQKITITAPVVTTNTNACAFIQSRLPFKRSFAMGASALKVKKFRLIVSMLLAIITFTIFGFSITAASIDKNVTIVKKMYEQNQNMMIIQSASMELQKRYHEDGSGKFDIHHLLRPLSEKQINIIKKYNNNIDPMCANSVYDGPFGPVDVEYDLNFADRLFLDLPNERYYQLGLSHQVVELDLVRGLEQASLKPDNRFVNKSLSRLPQNFTEIAITDFTADKFIRFGYKSDDGEKIDIKKPDDLIGKQVGDFIIVGVYATDIDRTEVERLFVSDKDRSKGYEEYLENIYYGLRSSMINYSFVNKGFFSAKAGAFTPFNVLVKLSGNITADRNLLRALKYDEIIGNEFKHDVEVGAMFASVVVNATSYNYMLIPAGLTISGIFAVFSILLIMFFLNVSFDFKKKEIGILRALGARKRDIMVICLIEIIIITAINFIVSLIAVLTICAVINGLFYAQVFIFGVLQIFLLLLLCFGISLLATILPIIRITSKKPIDIINNK